MTYNKLGIDTIGCLVSGSCPRELFSTCVKCRQKDELTIKFYLLLKDVLWVNSFLLTNLPSIFPNIELYKMLFRSFKT
jgi:hypothetical protein